MSAAFTPRIDNHESRIAVSVAFAWVAIGLIEALETVFLSAGSPHPVPASVAFPREIAPWLAWSAATPIVLRLVRRCPFSPGHRLGAAARHLTMAAVLLLIHTAIYQLVSQALSGTGRLSAALAPARIERSMLGWLPVVAVAYIAVVAIAYSLEFAHRERQRAAEQVVLSEQLVRAELSALRMQLHPHFLFNALNTIAGLVRDQQPDQAVELIAELGQVLRHVLAGAGSQTAPLAQEIAFTERYLAIEQVRFQDRLQVHWRVADTVRDADVPSLLLQPLVENALRHGIGKRASAGDLEIGAERRDGSLVLWVSDDGPGVAEDAAGAEPGVGLANARARLSRLYGPGATLVLGARDGGGTVATVTIPETRNGAA